MSDARDRRRERAAQESKAHPLDVVKRYRVPLVIVLVWLAIVGYQVAAQRGIIGEPGGRCPGHWHAMTDVYLDDGNNATSDELTFDPRVNQAFGDAAGGYHLHDDTGRLHMHPSDRARLQIGDGDAVRVTSVRGTVELRTEANADLAEGTCFFPEHFNEPAVKDLVECLVDPTTGVPAFKLARVAIAKIEAERPPA